jgi:hypothetical protein
MRPGWAEALSMARSVLPFERLLSIDERMAHAAARPVIVPDTIVIDQRWRAICIVRVTFGRHPIGRIPVLPHLARDGQAERRKASGSIPPQT